MAALHLAGFLAWVTVLAVVFAHVEIQIEGPDGWAARLPTWRRPAPRFLRVLWGGRPVTGYHVYLFLFMALAFHLPYFLGLAFSFGVEARILAGLMLFWVMEDFFWFVFNPAHGLKAFRPGRVPWHPRWWCGVPADYLVYVALAAILLASSLAFGSGAAP